MWQGFRAAVIEPLRRAGIALAPTPGNHDASPSFAKERAEYIKQWPAADAGLGHTVAIRTEAEATSPLVRSTVAEADAARAGLSAAKSAYWPSLTLGGSTAWNATGANDYELLNQRQLTLGLRWNLFDRFDRELGA